MNIAVAWDVNQIKTLYILAMSEISIFQSVSVAKEICLSLAFSETQKIGLVALRPILAWPCMKTELQHVLWIYTKPV